MKRDEKLDRQARLEKRLHDIELWLMILVLSQMTVALIVMMIVYGWLYR